MNQDSSGAPGTFRSVIGDEIRCATPIIEISSTKLGQLNWIAWATLRINRLMWSRTPVPGSWHYSQLCCHPAVAAVGRRGRSVCWRRVKVVVVGLPQPVIAHWGRVALLIGGEPELREQYQVQQGFRYVS